MRVKFALGLFDHPFTTGSEVTNAVPEHRPLARRAAQESFVLLKNAGSDQAPAPSTTKHKKLALIGPFAEDSEDMVGAWSGANNFGDVITLRAALEQHASQNGTALLYAKGTDISGNSEAGFAEASEAASNADIAMLALGESSEMSGEAASRAHLNSQAISNSFWKRSRPQESRSSFLFFRAGHWFSIGPRPMFQRSWKSGSPVSKPVLPLSKRCSGTSRRAGS